MERAPPCPDDSTAHAYPLWHAARLAYGRFRVYSGYRSTEVACALGSLRACAQARPFSLPATSRPREHLPLASPHTGPVSSLDLSLCPRATGGDVLMVQCCDQAAGASYSGASYCSASIGRTADDACPLLPDELVARGVRMRTTNAMRSRLRSQLRCTASAPAAANLTIGVLGGSISAGPGGVSYAEHAVDTLNARRPAGVRVRLHKLATNAVGPAYMSQCFSQHATEWRELPTLVVLEYAVNDDSQPPVDMEVLVRQVVRMGALPLLLLHWGPRIMPNVPDAQRGPVGRRSNAAAYLQLARHYNVPSLDLLAASGLERRHGQQAVHFCAFISCGYTCDNLHPTRCGQRWLAQLVATAVEGLVATACATREQPREETAAVIARARSRSPACTSGAPALPPPLTWREPANASAERCGSDVGAENVRCWSNVGPKRRWNLQARSHHAGWSLVNMNQLRGRWSSVAGRQTLFKMSWQSHTPNASVEFLVACPPPLYRGVRLMYLKSKTLGFGKARVWIDGTWAADLSGYRPHQTSTFVPADLLVPAPAPSTRVRLRRQRSSIVRIVVLAETDSDTEAPRDKFGFGVHSLMCLR